MITTRGRYALQIFIDLAEHESDGYISLKSIAERQNLPKKYLEQIVPVLVKEKMIDGAHGKGGGYRLNRPPEQYNVGDILRLTEGGLVAVTCFDRKPEDCPHANECKTHSMWERYQDMTNRFFDGITVADLIKEPGLFQSKE
ncbi:MAG: Rrf2 family transcriptional regulator [Bacteroides sp.]|nr:Rrf2 family transcriptional regulator [Eubacterium sp.]MCM1418198.1 Rrf2 family transcriptional regulator [Roseburia sp.]MCM1462749.1 Rrf2 family transcriptional regulator [Bacteroides sp.]